MVTVLREEAARLSALSSDQIDFELIFDALVEAVERRNPISGGMIGALLAPHLGGADARRVLLDLLLYLRVLFLPSRSVEYLGGLLQTVRAHEGAVATLNYDLTVERWFTERGLPIRTGFVNLDWQGFSDSNDEPELLKLHGSVHWARSTLSMDDRYSILSHLIFRSEPFPVAVDHTARWATGELMEGVRPLMNIGVSKEQLYVTPPFSEIFRRFEMHLALADAIVVVGYSFRDYLINRLLLRAIRVQLRLRGNRPVIAVVDPDVKALVTNRAILGALNEYGVLVTVEQTAGSLTEADVLRWLATSLPSAPNGFSYRTPPAALPDGTRERLADVCIELASLRYQIQHALKHPVNPWRILEGIVHTIERCRGTYEQAVGSKHPGLRRTIAKMYSKHDVDSGAWRSAADQLLTGLASFSAQIEDLLERPQRVISVPASVDIGAADQLFDAFFDRLRSVGIGITQSQLVP